MCPVGQQAHCPFYVSSLLHMPACPSTAHLHIFTGGLPLACWDSPCLWALVVYNAPAASFKQVYRIYMCKCHSSFPLTGTILKHVFYTICKALSTGSNFSCATMEALEWKRTKQLIPETKGLSELFLMALRGCSGSCLQLGIGGGVLVGCSCTRKKITWIDFCSSPHPEELNCDDKDQQLYWSTELLYEIIAPCAKL